MGIDGDAGSMLLLKRQIDGNAGGRLMLYTARLPQDVREQIAQTARRCSQYLEEFSESEPFIFSEQTRAASLIRRII